MNVSAKLMLSWKGQQTGPFTIEEIRSKLAAGEVSLMHQVQAHGRWVTLDEFLSDQGQQRQEQQKQNAAREALLRSQETELRHQHEQQLAEERSKQDELQRRLDDLERQADRRRETLSPAQPLQGYIQGPIVGQAPSFTPRRASGLAIAALVMSLLNFVPGLNFVTWILALIFGHVALSNIKHDSTLEGRGMAIAGLVITYSLLGLGIAWGVLMALGVARFPKY